MTSFPFSPNVFVNLLFRESKGLRKLTGSHDVLLAIFAAGDNYLRDSQCSLNKGLEWVCGEVMRVFGQSIRPRFWRIAKDLCRATPPAHVRIHTHTQSHMPSHAHGLAVVPFDNTTDAWVVDQESWRRTARQQVHSSMENVDLWRRMNTQILEAILHQQAEFRSVWRNQPDYDVLFLAFAYARRGDRHDFSPAFASHYAGMAVRFEVDESRTGSAAFKGLRRWRNVVPDVVTDLTLRCIWNHHETPRHHQMWHLRRWIHEKQWQVATTRTTDAVFLLLIGVMNDHVFANIPPEDAADAVGTALYTPSPFTPRQTFDLHRLHLALRQPRTPYLCWLFPQEVDTTLEQWAHKLRMSPP